MNYLITGGSGLLGQALTDSLTADGHQVTILSRNPDTVYPRHENVKVLKWDGQTPAGWGKEMNDTDVVINLAGASIGGENLLKMRWTKARKEAILQSRLDAGKAITEAFRAASNKPKVLIQQSAIGYYGPRDETPIDETTGPGNDFQAVVVKQWEESVSEVAGMGVRVVTARTGLVLSELGGLLPTMKLPFYLLAGGPLGHGKQGMSWIHIDDWVKAVRFLIDNQSAQGVYNLTAPNPVNNKTFAKALGKVMKLPSFMPTPGLAVKLALGEVSTLALDGLFVSSRKLQQAGFMFNYQTLEPALEELNSRPMRFFRTFETDAPVSRVAEFHRDTRVLKMLTPFPIIVQFRHIESIKENSRAKFNLWFGPIPVYWDARHHDIVLDKSFCDTQEDGPFEYWFHTHTFAPTSSGGSVVVDDIRLKLGKGLFKGAVSRFMWATLPVLFAYRAWRTRREVRRPGLPRLSGQQTQGEMN